MKHNKEYIFNLDKDADVATVCSMLAELGYDHSHARMTMADGTVHQFIRLYSNYWEVPDLDAALEFIVDDIYLLKDFVDHGYIVEDKDA